MEKARKLIVTADDFGLTGRVNDAIAVAYTEGMVTTASLMVNGTAFESAVTIARREPGLDLGLHLNLTEGRPVSDTKTISSLAPDGGFLYRHPVRLAVAQVRGRIRSADLEREIRAQIEKALDAGLRITHIDGHKHVHAIPAVLRMIRRVAPEYGIHAIRSTRERVPRPASLLLRNKTSRRQILKQFLFGKVLSAAWRLSERSQTGPVLVSPGRLYGVTQTGFLDAAAFADIIEDLAAGTHELMCHPGFADDALRQTPTRLLGQREGDLQLATGPEARRLIRQAGVALISYRELLESYGNRESDPVLHRNSAP